MKRFAKNEYVIWLEFDDKCNEFLTKKCRELDKNHIKPGVRPPHLTLTFVQTDCADKLVEYTKLFFAENTVEISLNAIGCFSKRVLFYQPKATKELLLFQESFCQGILDFGQLSWDLYYPENWTPHIALTGELSKRAGAKAFSIMADDFKPIADCKVKKVFIMNCATGQNILDLCLQQIQ